MSVNETYFALALAWSIRTDFEFVKWLIDNRSFPEAAIENPMTRILYRAAINSYGKLAPRSTLPTMGDVIVELSSVADDEIANAWGARIVDMEMPAVSQARDIANTLVEKHDKELVVNTVQGWLEQVERNDSSIYKQFASMSDKVINLLVGERKTGRPRDILEAAWANRIRVPESTGYTRLDRPLDGGWTPGRFYVWGMPSGHGKSSMCCNFTSRRVEAGLPTVINSLEMPAPDLLFRMISDLAEVPISAAENPDGAAQSLQEYERIMKARDLLDTSVRIYDMPADSREMERRLRRHKAEFQDKSVFVQVDHVGIVQRNDRRGNEWAELENMAYSLANIAKMHEVPLLAFSQVPEGVEYELREQNMVIHHKDFRGSRGLRNAVDYAVMGCKHNGISRSGGVEEHDSSYRNHTVIQVIKNRRTGMQFWGVFLYDPTHYRLTNSKHENAKEDIYV